VGHDGGTPRNARKAFRRLYPSRQAPSVLQFGGLIGNSAETHISQIDLFPRKLDKAHQHFPSEPPRGTKDGLGEKNQVAIPKGNLEIDGPRNE